MKRRNQPTLRFLLHVLSSATLVVVLAACSNDAFVPTDAPTLAPQASGSFSGGSLFRGSVEGEFDGVGVGTTLHEVVMTVHGTLWYECSNNGGNLAPGQYDFAGAAAESLEGQIDENGRFVGVDVIIDNGNPACKKNWHPTTFTDSSEPLTFLQVHRVVANLYAHSDGDFDTKDDRSLSDTIAWNCDDPAPPDDPEFGTYSENLEAYALGSHPAGPPPALGAICTLDTSGRTGGPKIR